MKFLLLFSFITLNCFDAYAAAGGDESEDTTTNRAVMTYYDNMLVIGKDTDISQSLEEGQVYGLIPARGPEDLKIIFINAEQPSFSVYINSKYLPVYKNENPDTREQNYLLSEEDSKLTYDITLRTAYPDLETPKAIFFQINQTVLKTTTYSGEEEEVNYNILFLEKSSTETEEEFADKFTIKKRDS